MSTNQRYAAGLLAEQWTNGTQAADPKPAGYTAWDGTGAVTTQRGLTADEAAMLAAQDSATTQATNSSTLTANVLASQAQIQAWITAHPTGAVLTAGQTLTLAKMLNGVCKILLEQFGDTTGT